MSATAMIRRPRVRLKPPQQPGRPRKNLTGMNELNEAIVAAGGNSKLAAALGISSQAVSNWNNCPAERVLDVERLTGVSRYRLRPDVFGPDPKGQRK